jgi:3-oxoacid CoA-transferase
LVELGGFPIKYAPDKSIEILSEPKESKMFDGQRHVMEESITGDFSLVRAWRADEFGNLQFRKATQNFNRDAATAGKICIAEVEEIVPVGTMDPDQIHLPSVYVNRIVKAENTEKRVEFKTLFSGDEVKIPGNEEA